MQNNISETTKRRRYYTEAEVNARVEEVVAERLAQILDKSERVMQGFLLANAVNSALHKELTKAEANAERMTRAAIIYEETYSRLPEEMREEFRKINSEVCKNYEL